MIDTQDPKQQLIERIIPLLNQEFDRVWGAALDASKSDDFRNKDGSLNEQAYLKYQTNTRKLFIEAIASAWLEELDKQHQSSRIMAYRDVATKAGSGNDVRRYAESRASQLAALTNKSKEQ